MLAHSLNSTTPFPFIWTLLQMYLGRARGEANSRVVNMPTSYRATRQQVLVSLSYLPTYVGTYLHLSVC